MADRLENDLAGRKEVNVHLDYLRKREALMQYPVFQSSGWPIGSGMVESANKNIVEARLKGPGMHWQRTHVNPLLALRNAVCNDRWGEMWQKMVLHQRKLQALQRSTRAKPRMSAFLAVDHSSSLESSSQSPLEPSPPVSEAPSPSVLSPAPAAAQPSSCRLSSRRKRHTARNRVKYVPPRSGEASGETCICGTPLARFKGHRPKQYCSDRCRQRAHRERQAQGS